MDKQVVVPCQYHRHAEIPRLVVTGAEEMIRMFKIIHGPSTILSAIYANDPSLFQIRASFNLLFLFILSIGYCTLE